MTLTWTTTPPSAPGFYYWQDLCAVDENAVRLVQVSRYANREGFQCHTLTRRGEPSPPVFDTTLGHEPPGRWAGPLPQPTSRSQVNSNEAFDDWGKANSDGYGFDAGLGCPSDVAERFARRVWEAAVAADREWLAQRLASLPLAGNNTQQLEWYEHGIRDCVAAIRRSDDS